MSGHGVSINIQMQLLAAGPKDAENSWMICSRVKLLLVTFGEGEGEGGCGSRALLDRDNTGLLLLLLL